MAKIIVNKDTFPNIVIAYLLDNFLHPDEMSAGNELFTEFMKKAKGRGLMPIVRSYYLEMDSDYRIKYKLIKDVFYGENQAQHITIFPKDKEEREKEADKPGIIKKILSKALKVLVSSKEFSELELELIKESLDHKEDDNING